MADGTQPARTEDVYPQNIEAEQALLGALLLNNRLYDDIAALVGPHHFHDPVHGRIFSTAARLIQKDMLASPVTLKSFLAEDEGLTALGGAAYLARLPSVSVALSSANQYAETIRDLALRRHLIDIGQDIAGRARRFDTEEAPDNQIEKAEEALYNLAERGKVSTGFVDFGTAAAEAAKIANAAFKRRGKLAGLSTGLMAMDDKLGGFRKSDLIILAARPSMGKSSLAMNIAFDIARRRLKEGGEGGVVAFFSLEMAADQLANRILAAESRIDSSKLLRGDIQQDQFFQFLDVACTLEQAPLYIDATPALPIAQMVARARRLKRQKKGLDLVVVDYLQLMQGSGRGRSAENRVLELSEITQGLKAMAKDLEVPVLALSQLSRKVEEREDKRPQLSDLRESGSIEQDADIVMFIYRDSYYHERLRPAEDDAKYPEWAERADKLRGRTEVIISKQRHGPIGTIELSFEDRFTKFSDLVRDESRYTDRDRQDLQDFS
ncbi:MAG: replicative DNA helicase [Pseudomonadota bacterium]